MIKPDLSKIGVCLLLFMLGVGNAIAVSPAKVDGKRIINADREPGNWMSTGRTYGEQRFSPLKKINADNVKELGLAWSYKLDVDRGVEATPIVVDGVMYTTGAFSMVYALDARSGKLLWKYDPKVKRDAGKMGCCDVVNRGVAVWKGRIYVGVFDGRLVALDAATGKPGWSVDTVIDHHRSTTITGAPRIVKGKVIIGNGGAELGMRGYLSAYDSETGKLRWRFFTVPGDPKLPPENAAMAMARKTWFGDRWWNEGGGGGGTPWDSMAYDPELDLLYVGTGNGSMWNRQIRSEGHGDNLFLSSIIALRPDTGAYVWHYQTTPGDTWDYTATQPIVLADLEIGGKLRKVLMQAPKNSFFYVIDRATGELLSAEKFVPSTWATHVDMKTGRPVETPEADWPKNGPALISPSPIGAHNWQPMSFSPLTGLVYLPAQHTVGLYDPDNTAKWKEGQWNLGMKTFAFPESSEQLNAIASSYTGELIAWNPVTNKPAWSHAYPGIWNGGTLSTAGNLVFQGTAQGQVMAYRADTGETLWQAEANTGVMAGPVTFEAAGEQYVTFMAGWGGSFALTLGGIAQSAKVQSDARILTFKLGGKATLPPRKLMPVLPSGELPPLTADAATVDHGRQIFNGFCGACHGLSALGGGVIPDLRYLSPDKHKIFNGIVGGIYAERGMPGFAGTLNAADIEAVHQYIIRRTQDLVADIAREKAASVAPTPAQ